MKKVLSLTVFILSQLVVAQEKTKIIDSLTYEQQSGLPVAASKIYFSDAKYTISGFGESNFIFYDGAKNRESNDLELYNTNLQRFVIYGAYKPVDWLVIYAEFFAELLNDGNEEKHFEYLPEFFLDFLIDPRFNVRVGTHQPGIGYINNNDEPILFHSVNRPEVERILIPSQWIDLGLMTYGKITDNLKWSASIYQGLDASNLNGATWIRRGRDESLRFNFDSFLLNSKLTYKGIKNTELSVSGIFTPLLNNSVNKANTFLGSAYARYTKGNFSVMGLGTFGQMNNTIDVFNRTMSSDLGGQVLGSQVYGYYIETSYDILPLLGFDKTKHKQRKGFLYNKSEFKLPLFVRYERLNTHAKINESLSQLPRSQNDLSAVTVGLNFNTKRNIVFKANYQFRNNRIPLNTGEMEGNRFEFGLGFIF